MKPRTFPLSFAKLALVSALLSTVSVLTAAPVVTWGPSPSYVGGFTNATGLSGGVVAFSDTVARNPGSPYPNGQPSGTYYGGAVSQNSGGISLWRVGNGASGADDFLNYGSILAPGESATSVFLWTQSTFLNGLNTGNVTLASANAFSASLAVAGGSAMAGSAFRWLIEVGGDYYLSSASGLTTTRTTYSLSDPSTVSWFSYDPSSSLSAIGAEWATPDFSNLTGVGVWMQSVNSSPSATITGEGRLFAFEAAAVPEPATAALLGGGLLLLGLHRRNRTGR